MTKKSINIGSAASINHNYHDTLRTRWPAKLALLIVALLYEALPKIFYWGPRGLMISLVILLTIPMILSHWFKNYRLNRWFAISVNALITVYIIISVSRVVIATWHGQIGPNHLLMSSMILWATNILAFALWYWNLDAGGPNLRSLGEKSNLTAFLFPQTQLALSENTLLPDVIKHWRPQFIDYLFLAFNTSTAFSPTDTPILSRWAKAMSMLQALISLTIVLMLAARAINILNPSASYFISTR